MKRYGRTTQGGGTGASLRDLHNYLVTSPRIDGEWSDPVYLNSSGFDPSLFHDDDGRKYLLNMLWDHRPGHNRFAGIVPAGILRRKERKLVGQPHLIFEGTALGFTEGPHLYKRDGYYYLLTAEGGTGWGHAVTMARSRELTGPYELHPDVYILTSRHRPDIELQRAGHADLVETQTGETYMVHLCGRPLRNRGRCTLGRETAIQQMVWSARRLAAHGGWRGAPVFRGRRAGTAGPHFPRAARARRLRPARTPPRLPVAALALAGGALQPDRASRPPAPVRPRNAGQPVSPVPGGAAAAVALLQRRHRDRFRAGPVPADGGPGLLLQRQQVSLPLHLA